jgi:hypothetical protein
VGRLRPLADLPNCRSAPAPVNVLPVADQRQSKQKDRYQQQPGGLRGVCGLAVRFVNIAGFARGEHADIVALGCG